jgi:hypothetical protein
MAKKTFKDNTKHLDRFFSETGEESDTHRTPAGRTGGHETDKAQQTHTTHTIDKPTYYRLNLKLKAEYKEYLSHVSWQNKQSITQYLNDLIEADKAKKDIEGTKNT